MKYYAVIDTNVIVSAMLKWDSVPGNLMDALFDGTIIPIINKSIVDEYRAVLSRDKFAFPEETIEAVMDFFLSVAVIVNPDKSSIKFIDPKDAVFYEVTMKEREKEETYLVTGNIKHFPKEYYVVTPREMLDIITNTDTCEKR